MAPGVDAFLALWETLRFDAEEYRELEDGSVLVIAARLGEDPTMLLSSYAHLLPRSDAQAAEALAAILVDSSLTGQPV